MKVAMARLEANKPTVMPMVTDWDPSQRTAISVINGRHALNHIQPGAKPTRD